MLKSHDSTQQYTQGTKKLNKIAGKTRLETVMDSHGILIQHRNNCDYSASAGTKGKFERSGLGVSRFYYVWTPRNRKGVLKWTCKWTTKTTEYNRLWGDEKSNVYRKRSLWQKTTGYTDNSAVPNFTIKVSRGDVFFRPTEWRIERTDGTALEVNNEINYLCDSINVIV